MPKKSEFRFTDASIRTLKAREGKKDYIVFDSETRGLGIRVTAFSKIFVVRYWDPINLCKKQESIGAYGSITLAQARDALRIKLGDAAKGRSPYEEKQQAKEQKRIEKQKARLTLGVLLDEYDTQHLKNKRPLYRSEVLRQIKHHLAEYIDFPAEHLKREHVEKVTDNLKKKKEFGNARNLCAYGRTLYNWTKAKGYFSHNPFDNLKVPSPQSRNRVLTDKELAKIYRGAAKESYPFGDFICLLILTGQRRNEVAGMRWEEISDDYSTWTIPEERAKNKKSHIVHLNHGAQKILKKVKKIRLFPKSSFVFTTNGKSAISGFSKAKTALDEASKISNWRFHDFRRTIVTYLAKAGISHVIADKILNHQEGALSSIAAVYQRYEYLDERKKALDTWGKYIQKITR